jgi:hypothetical protein
MNWEAMTPEEKNELVYSKVMGQSLEVPCTAEEDDINDIRRPEDRYQDRGWWICDVCGYIGHGDDYSHMRQLKIPNYTQSMDAAWLVVEHFKGATLYALMPSDTDPRMPDMRYDVRLYTDEHNSYGASEKTMPLAICKAALQASGVEVK